MFCLIVDHFEFDKDTRPHMLISMSHIFIQVVCNQTVNVKNMTTQFNFLKKAVSICFSD